MCCLWGLIDYNGHLSNRQKTHLLTSLARESEARGTDACGIAFNGRNSLTVTKRAVFPRKFRFPNSENARVVMGHTRMTTQGSEKKNQNNHPFLGKVQEGNFALAHNGVLHNDDLLKTTHHLPTTKIETDSYVAVQLLEQKNTLHPDSLQYMAEQVEGTFVFTVLDEDDNLTFIKGENPLAIFHYPRLGLYLYASTENILKQAIKRTWLFHEEFEEVVVASGDILQIDCHGQRQRFKFTLPDPWDAWGYSYAYFRPKHLSAKSVRSNSHIEELKAMAYTFGYSPEDVDLLLKEGFSEEEIEDYFYSHDEVEIAGCYGW